MPQGSSSCPQGYTGNLRCAKLHTFPPVLNWYIKEQVEEEESVGGVLATLKLIGNDSQGLLALDKELAARVFNPPVIG